MKCKCGRDMYVLNDDMQGHVEYEPCECQTPHKTGYCQCRLCGHKYVGVWPVGVVVGEENMECPNCGNMTSGPERGEP